MKFPKSKIGAVLVAIYIVIIIILVVDTINCFGPDYPSGFNGLCGLFLLFTTLPWSLIFIHVVLLPYPFNFNVTSYYGWIFYVIFWFFKLFICNH